MTKKILLISYHFPPSQAVGGLRIANFARYLPLSEWEPSVLTIRDKYIDNKDFDRLQGLEKVVIHKTGKVPELISLYSSLKSYAKTILCRSRDGDAGGAIVYDSLETGGHSRETVPQRVKRYFASLFLALPDYEKNWILPAAYRAIREIRRQKVDCILTSCPPYSVHIVGLLANLVTGVKWVVDFRDPWYIASRKKMYPTCQLSRKIESWLERAAIKRAILVLCNTEKLRTTLEQAYQACGKDKFVFIPNGISTDIFQTLNHLKKYEKLTLTYTGSLYFFRTPEPVFKVVRELIDEGKLDRNEVAIKLVGHCQSIDGYPTKDLVASYGLEEVVEILPPVSYQASLEIVKKSHVALLFAPDQPYQIPAKVYDYMGTGTKILALAGEGATAEMVLNTKTGSVFRPEDHDGIKAFLTKVMMDLLPVEETHVAQVMARFDRQRTVSELAKNLNEHINS